MGTLEAGCRHTGVVELRCLPAPTSPAPCSSISWALGNGTCEAPVRASLNKRVIRLHTLCLEVSEKRGNGGGRVGFPGMEGFPRAGVAFWWGSPV